MNSDSTTTKATPRWSVKTFEAFWSNPDPARAPAAMTDDIVGYWAGLDQPVHGKDAYTRCIAALVEAIPDVRVRVAEHASDGEYTFIRWVMNGTGEHGPFDLTGIDRVRIRDGLVAENFVVFDSAAFQARTGMPIPWLERDQG